MSDIQSSALGLTYLYISTSLERLVYFGIRSIIILFLVGAVHDGSVGLDEAEAFKKYGLFTLAVYFFCIVGGLLADFAFEKLKVIYWGLLLLAIGTFILSLGGVNTITFGLLVIAVGVGLFKSASQALIAIQCYDKPEKQDGVFYLNEVAINLGALLGPLSIAVVAESYGWNYGFYLAIFLVFIAFMVLRLGQRNIKLKIVEPLIGYSIKLKEVKNVLFFSVLSIVYYFSLDIAEDVWQGIKQPFEVSEEFIQYIYVLLYFFGLILLSVIWFFWKVSSWVKLFIGMAIFSTNWMVMGYVLPLIPDTYMFIWIVAIEVLFVISELFFSPILMSLVAQYSPKNAIASSLAIYSLLTMATNMLVGYVAGVSGEDSIIANYSLLYVIFGVSLLITLVLFFLVFKKRNEVLNDS
ncbi:POT-type proton-dependent oligopeptide transporter [Aliikangiella sp. IMCC44359]|uniref:POT-type proton-dependent oligopeptide transporter n=1 Tax=Aliikangiella sp. IMCC44359 TaxID=3459125 RepID=UPI00403B3513